jgi:hypothetical protein
MAGFLKGGLPVRIKRIAILACAVASCVLVAVDVGAEPEANTMVGPPELGVAVLVDRHTIEVRRFVETMVTRTTVSNLPPGVKIKTKEGFIGPPTVTELVPVVGTTIERFEVREIAGRRIDGRVISQELLVRELARATPMLLLKQDQRLNPLFAKMFKPESLVLLLPRQRITTIAPD